MDRKIVLPVRQFVEFVLRTGDIDTRLGSGARMLEGAKAHRRLQKLAGEDYDPEVTLRCQFQYRGFDITLEGRADGIITHENEVTVDEIKSTDRPLAEITRDAVPAHWAQAECYAFILSRENDLGSINVRLTYCEAEGDGVVRFEKLLGAQELTDIVHSLFDKYIDFATFQYDRTMRRDSAIRALGFPYENYRPGQRQFAACVYRTVASGGRLLAQAPTGIGKTISSLFPAVKAMGEGLTDRIFYLTARTTTRRAAVDAVKLMSGLAPDFKTVVLTAKDKICPNPDSACNPDECELARGYYDRLSDALLELIGGESLIDRAQLENFAAAHKLCPFEFGLDAAEWCDLIICDYNYVFDPSVYLRRFFGGTPTQCTLLVDEAHNLVDRSREMYSAELTKAPFLKASKMFKKQSGGIAAAARGINKHFVALRKRCEEEELDFISSSEQDDELCRLIEAFTHKTERFLAKAKPSESVDELTQLYFDCLRYLRIAGYYGVNCVTAVKRERDEVTSRICCLDASPGLSATLDLTRSAIFFSATLSPQTYFRDVFGAGGECRMIRLPSPFRQDNLCLLVDDRVSTKFKDREDTLEGVAKLLAVFVRQRPGNYIIYFPSYRYMTEVYNEFIRLCGDGVRTAVQQPQMSDEERDAFLAAFEPGASEPFAAFCILGGVFSEGIDLTGERLIGTAIVGVGLPQLSEEQNLIRGYFDRQGGLGFEYAYMYPGMNKVLQAAGRVIRTDSDRGAVLLIDGRFTRRDYLALYPAHWSHYLRVAGPEDVAGHLRGFWNVSGTQTDGEVD
jgi:Rad3-related DNA helicase